ncbi:MAG TPA: type II toxin-antitoxin system CcdA family antitoxin [Acidimicrobiales bacterium]|nr:type II toxin-antitoxin system CcdA family antitoxin [Acidimicrobiales bacterium]
MPKVSVYLPDELYRAARERDLSISTLAQEAIRDALAKGANTAWIERMRQRPVRDLDLDVSVLMDDVRDEFGR